MRIKSIFIALFAMPVLAWGMPADRCVSFPFLKSGFDMAAYQQCKQSLKACASDRVCIRQAAAKPACTQLDGLAKELDATPDALTASPLKQFILLKHDYLADGQVDYAVISPKSCVVNPKMYPLNFNTVLRELRKAKDYYPVVGGEPKLEVKANGVQSITIPLEVHDICLACEVLGTANLHIDFTAEGLYIQTQLTPSG